MRVLGVGAACFLVGVFISACGAAQVYFPFKTYAIYADQYGGVLKAKDPKDDRAFQECQPTGKNAECFAIQKAEFFRLLKEHSEMHQRIIDLEKQCPAR